ncbi:hypothetical protein [Amycolatopsis taiwanensis]|uniref:hypothetical protein n=1 Tax=Amycolatopsis taiwanensis TaxID=342230 RepID=UPI00069474D7|nr:hypothetical protein [Amycolatopsis taiwanensis]
MSWWDDVKFVVTGEQGTAVKMVGQAFARKASGAALGQAGFTTGTAGAAVSSGSGSAGVISMSREEMEDTLKRAQNLLADINYAMESAPRLQNMRAPAKDPATVAATDSANNGGKYYVGHLRRQKAYLDKVVERMQKALGMTVQGDEQAAGTVNRAGEGIAG